MEREEVSPLNWFGDHHTINCSSEDNSSRYNITMKLTLLAIMLTFAAVRSIPLDAGQDENYISMKVSKEAEGNDLRPAEFFYPGFGFGFPFSGFNFYSKPYWHPLHTFKPYYHGYYSGLNHGSLWNYKF